MIHAHIRQAALRGEKFRCMGGVRRRFMKAKTGPVSGGVLEAGSEDMDTQVRRVVLSGLEWSGTPGGGLVRYSERRLSNVSSSASCQCSS
jgi:hypothetical protein